MGGSGYAFNQLREIVGIDFAIQFVAWAAASALHTEKFYDATGALTYWSLIIKAYGYASRDKKEITDDASDTNAVARQQNKGRGAESKGASMRQKVVASMVLMWSLRLGSFLGYRGWKYGDSRFEKVKHRPATFLIFWLVQGFWCMLTPLPAYLLLLRRPADDAPLVPSDYAAWAGWLVGFLTEANADRQKSAWKDAGNTGFMHSGIWRYSQHPNYFGEISLWVCLTLTCCNGLRDWTAKLASCVSPVFTSYLLLFVSGMPLLQKAAMKKYGKDPAFLAYRANTSLLIPRPW